MPPRVGGYYANDGVGGGRALPGGAFNQNPISLGADLALPAVTTTSLGNLGAIYREDGTYDIDIDGALLIVIGATAPTSITFDLANPSSGSIANLATQIVPTPLLVANNTLMLPLSLSCRITGVASSLSSVQNLTLRATTAGAAGTATIKAGSVASFTAYKEQD